MCLAKCDDDVDGGRLFYEFSFFLLCSNFLRALFSVVFYLNLPFFFRSFLWMLRFRIWGGHGVFNICFFFWLFFTLLRRPPMHLPHDDDEIILLVIAFLHDSNCRYALADSVWHGKKFTTYSSILFLHVMIPHHARSWEAKKSDKRAFKHRLCTFGYWPIDSFVSCLELPARGSKTGSYLHLQSSSSSRMSLFISIFIQHHAMQTCRVSGAISASSDTYTFFSLFLLTKEI